MRAKDVTGTLDLASQASGCGQVHVAHKQRLLTDNGSSNVSGDMAEWLKGKGTKHSRGEPYQPVTQEQDRALASDPEEPHHAIKPPTAS